MWELNNIYQMSNSFRSEVDKQHLLSLLHQQGISPSEFRNAYWDSDTTHQTLEYFNRSPRLSLPSLIKICDILDLTPNDILQKSDKESGSPTDVGKKTFSQLKEDLRNLQIANHQQEQVIELLKDKIKFLQESLKEKQDLIDFFTNRGQKSDKKIEDSSENKEHC